MANSIYLAQVGTMQTARMSFVEDATSTSHTASVSIPVGAIVPDIYISVVEWAAASSLNLGDATDADGYFSAWDLGPSNGTYTTSTFWNGDGLYLTAIGSGYNGGFWYPNGGTITATVSVGTPSGTVGRLVVHVFYTVASAVPIVSA